MSTLGRPAALAIGLQVWSGGTAGRSRHVTHSNVTLGNTSTPHRSTHVIYLVFPDERHFRRSHAPAQPRTGAATHRFDYTPDPLQVTGLMLTVTSEAFG
jgi:hypothetical protein